MSYYRAENKFIGDNVIFEPNGYYEEVDEDENPIMLDDEYSESEVGEVCASKYIGGAVLGHYSLIKSNVFYIYEINEIPDVDISHWSGGDFSVIQEVRYRKNVNGKYLGTVNLSDNQKYIIDCFYKAISGEEISDEERGILEQNGIDDFTNDFDDVFNNIKLSMIRKSQPHAETNDNHYIDLEIESVQRKDRVGYLEDFINDTFDIGGYYFNDLNEDDQIRIFNYYEEMKKKSKMNKIQMIKMSLMMSSGFMQMWKNPEKYRKFIERYAEDIRKNKGSVKKTDKIYADKNYLNEYDFEAIHNDYKKYREGNPLSNEEGFKNKSQESNQQEQEDNNIEEQTNDNPNKVELDLKSEPNKKTEEQVREKVEDYAPYYDTESIQVRKLDKGDVLYIQDDWWVVFKKSRIKIWVQNIWNKKIKTFRKEPTDKVEILTDESINKIINEFKDENLEHKLPKQLQNLN